MNKYSVPYDLIGEKVNLRLTPDTVEVFFQGSRVAIHVRSKAFRREPVMKLEHMPMEHRAYLSYNEKGIHRLGEHWRPQHRRCGQILSGRQGAGAEL